ncbi:hypothetical protein G647_00075 [Cladophialophora carrionii CBS 160.54]|uniref:Uncharacterized protein n=1 Tax=Cladophialophora carrionii CBS 160.54 TaxID=1279043 RepID=V9DLT7_9EURO|nr:uncharacterized protein G647_00075 [Cladophialophora carrionii CBS 160.54]ETI27626.1 hypothetical protein G647_00075 [Cladophialophora carrionii CBS 160.54]
MGIGAEVTVSIVFGVFMAIIALLGLWQVAHYAARSLRTPNHQNSFELEA